MKNFLFLTVLMAAMATTLHAQIADEHEDEYQLINNTIMIDVEKQPEFRGGMEGLMNYLSTNIVYPEKAKEEHITGTVYVRFVVEKDGSVSNVKVLRGIGGGCDEEAVRVVSKMPRWEPRMHKGKPVRVQYTLPLNFQLQ